MQQTEASGRYDAIIIGVGQGGKPLALSFAKVGKKVAIIERGYVGGTCVNVGCTPTKTMVGSARTAYLARRAEEYGVHTGPVAVDMAKVRTRKQGIVESFRNGTQRRLESTDGVDLLLGHARFTTHQSIEVKMHSGETRLLTAEKIFINTGAQPSLPPLEGLVTVPFLDSTSIMELDILPKHLIVLGGGFIALEFAQMFNRFGSDVTIVQRGSQLLSREDTDVAEEVAKILSEDGIEILLNTSSSRVDERGGIIHLTVRDEARERTIDGSHLLVATGRRPNTDKLNLPAAGVQMNERGFIKVNERLETNVPGIYALGDVNGGPAFTHIAYDDYRIVADNLLHHGNSTTKDRLVPSVVYIDPQLARVGLSEKEARAQGQSYRVAKMPMTYVARAIEFGETRGFMKVLVDPETDQILGCMVLGMEGGEMMSMLEIAMMGKVPASVLKEAIFAHPTLAEAFNNLFNDDVGWIEWRLNNVSKSELALGGRTSRMVYHE